MSVRLATIEDAMMPKSRNLETGAAVNPEASMVMGLGSWSLYLLDVA